MQGQYSCQESMTMHRTVPCSHTRVLQLSTSTDSVDHQADSGQASVIVALIEVVIALTKKGR